MWSLFGLLAVGGYIIVKYIDDASTAEANELRRRRSKDINKQIEMSYDEIRTLDKSLKDDRCREELLLSINDEMKYVYGEQWYSLLKNSTYSSSIYNELNTIWGIVFHLLCAKSGKIVPNQINYSLAGSPELCGQKIRACEIIERYIRKIHPDLELIFIPGWKVSSDYYEEIYMGKLWWRHNLPVLNKEQKIYIKKLW